MRETPEKVATPPTALTVVVPDSVPPAGFAPSPSDTAPTNRVAVLPLASRAVTTIDGAMAVPAGPLDGCVVKASVAGAPALTVKGALVTPVRPLLAPRSVTLAPTALMERSPNRATPFTAVTIVVPPRSAPTGPLPNAMVTGPVKLVAVLPKLSWASTTTAGENATPAFTAEGCVVNTSLLAAPATPMAEKVCVAPVTFTTEADTVCAPVAPPSVHTTEASPFASVRDCAVDRVPPPDVTENETGTPWTPTLSTALTRTRSGWASAAPTAPVWPDPLCATSALAVGCTVRAALTDGGGVLTTVWSREAVTDTLPRVVPPTTAPTAPLGTDAFAGSEVLQRMGVLGIVTPDASKASAVNVAVCPKATTAGLATKRTPVALAP